MSFTADASKVRPSLVATFIETSPFEMIPAPVPSILTWTKTIVERIRLRINVIVKLAIKMIVGCKVRENKDNNNGQLILKFHVEVGGKDRNGEAKKEAKGTEKESENQARKDPKIELSGPQCKTSNLTRSNHSYTNKDTENQNNPSRFRFKGNVMRIIVGVTWTISWLIV